MSWKGLLVLLLFAVGLVVGHHYGWGDSIIFGLERFGEVADKLTPPLSDVFPD